MRSTRAPLLSEVVAAGAAPRGSKTYDTSDDAVWIMTERERSPRAESRVGLRTLTDCATFQLLEVKVTVDGLKDKIGEDAAASPAVLSSTKDTVTGSDGIEVRVMDRAFAAPVAEPSSTSMKLVTEPMETPGKSELSVTTTLRVVLS